MSDSDLDITEEGRKQRRCRMEVEVSEGMTEPSQPLEPGEKRVDKECRGSLEFGKSERGVHDRLRDTYKHSSLDCWLHTSYSSSL